MSKETEKLDKWFGEHFEISFVGGNKKDNKKLEKNITKKLKEDIIKENKYPCSECGDAVIDLREGKEGDICGVCGTEEDARGL